MPRLSVDLDNIQKTKLLTIKNSMCAASQAEVVRRLIASYKIPSGKEYQKGIIVIEPSIDKKA